MTDRRSFLKLIAGGVALPLVDLAAAPVVAGVLPAALERPRPTRLVFDPCIRAVMAEDIAPHVWRTSPDDWRLHFLADGPTIEHDGDPLTLEAIRACTVAELWLDVGPWQRRFYTWRPRHLIACDTLNVIALQLKLDGTPA